MGNTHFRRSGQGVCAVHPHVRGEYTFHLIPFWANSGSSPRAWGIHLPSNTVLGKFRFIPTCVGNTALSIFFSLLLAVHPHVRGEYASACPIVSATLGSSPRAWGILQDKPMRPNPSRFIPTCVGNTFSYFTPLVKYPVHPHVRGEYRLRRGRRDSVVGSSPRAWGIQPFTCYYAGSRRFIPTCVGNTRFAKKNAWHVKVHPHVRGEYGLGDVPAWLRPGSSPRAWGIRRR